MSSAQRLLVVGGNGLVGSAVCKKALANGWQVTSLSRRGTPFKTRSGHQPQWTEKVNWVQGSADDKPLLKELVSDSTAAVSTLGVLLEGAPYKNENGMPSPTALLRRLARGRSDSINPLDRGMQRSYKQMNHDVHLDLAQLCIDRAKNDQSLSHQRYPFAYISAEDITRPLIPRGYIHWKRECEKHILQLNNKNGHPLRPILVRPSIIYEPHLNPWSTVPATLVDISARIRPHLPSPFPLRTQSSYDSLPSFLISIDSATRIPPIHVDTIAEALMQAIADDSFEGVLDVKRMRKMLHFDDAFDLYES